MLKGYPGRFSVDPHRFITVHYSVFRITGEDSRGDQSRRNINNWQLDSIYKCE